MKKLLVVGIILLLICMSIPSTGRIMDKSNPLSGEGNILYVGGSGPGNYTKIQDAIDNASDGDTVFVYNGTYYEDIVINVSINLIGENKDITFIDGNNTDDYVEVNADGVIISGFTIQNGLYGIGCITNNTKILDNIFIGKYDCIVCWGNNNTISGNNISLCEGTPIRFGGSDNIISGNHIYSSADIYITFWWGEILSYGGCERTIIANNTLINVDGEDRHGISLYKDVRDNIIEGNIISGYNSTGVSGIYINKGVNNTVSRNTVYDNYKGMYFSSCYETNLSKNIFRNNGQGIYIGGRFNNISSNIFINNNKGLVVGGRRNNITGNAMLDNKLGIELHESMFSNVYKNNFLNNSRNARFSTRSCLNKWDGNYWNKPRDSPKIIIGNLREGLFLFFLTIPWVNFDWHPAQEPYEI